MSKKNKYKPSQSKGPKQENTVPYLILGTNFDLDQRYEILEPVGSGAYGVVVSVRDKITDELLAVKKIEKAFDHNTFTKRTLRELRIMRLLDHENILSIQTIQLPTSRRLFSELYIITELMDSDLLSVIRSQQVLCDDHVQFFMYQLFRGCKYMHSAEIIHRDLKPRNLLVNQNCDLKICDFGLAKANLPDIRVRSTQMTDYVGTRWYRAPEALLGCRYDKGIDTWAIGCIFAELLARKPLFPGQNAQGQIELILNLLGSPNKEYVNGITKSKARDFLMTFEPREGTGLDELFADHNPDAVDLLKKLIVFDPSQRISAKEALAHVYFEGLHTEEDEPETIPVSRFDFEFENQIVSATDLKDKIYQEILFYHFPRKQVEYEESKKDYEENRRDATMIQTEVLIRTGSESSSENSDWY